MLKGAGYDIPYAVVASGMVRVEGKIFSKSRGYVIWVEEDYLAKGLDPDSLRYYIASYTGHTRDLDFSWGTFGEKVNKELVGTLGNFLYRSLLFAHRNYGSVPESSIEQEVKAAIERAVQTIRDALDKYEFKKISDAIISLATFGNRYLQSREPWKNMETHPEKARQSIYNCLWLSKAIAVVMEPVMPLRAEALWSQLCGNPRKNVSLSEALEPLNSGMAIREPAPLFELVSMDELKDLSDNISKLK
jgi:methionyl-tRNA synthetase